MASTISAWRRCRGHVRRREKRSSASPPRPSAEPTSISSRGSIQFGRASFLVTSRSASSRSSARALKREYTVGQRVIVGAITPCGQCFYCLNGVHSQCHGALGGWRFGNTINGAWAEYLLVPDARANLALVPDELTDEQVLMLPDIASTGISGAESGNVRRSATAWRCSRRVRSDCVPRWAPSSEGPG